MAYSRRQVLSVGSKVLVLSSFGTFPGFSSASNETILALTKGADIRDEGVVLRTPEIAENGNNVPIDVEAPGALMITVFALGNPKPGVASFNFGPLAGSSSGTTRIRLSKTQEVVAIAKMGDGSFRRASNEVKVTIGGCGG